MADVTLKAGDTTPEFEEQLTDESGDPIELTGNEEIRFYMEAPTSPGASDGDLIINSPVTSVNEAQAEVTYDFQKGETSRVGTHLAEVVVTFGDGEVRTWPNGDRYFTIDINRTVNRDAEPESAPDKDITVGTITADVVNAGVANVDELSVTDVLDAPSYPTQNDLPADRSVGFIALIEDENRIYFEGA